MCKCNPSIRTPYCGAIGCRAEDVIPSDAKKEIDIALKVYKKYALQNDQSMQNPFVKWCKEHSSFEVPKSCSFDSVIGDCGACANMDQTFICRECVWDPMLSDMGRSNKFLAKE